MKRSALFLSPEPPYPVMGGGPNRTASLIEYLARDFEIDLVLFAVEGASDPEAAAPRALVRDVLKLPLPAHSRRSLARVIRNGLRLIRGRPPLLDRFSGRHEPLARWIAGRRYDVGWIEHFWCAPYVETMAPACGHLCLDLHNIESEWHARAAAADPWPLSAGHRRFARQYRELEASLLPRFHSILAPSERDAEAIAPHRVRVYPNAIPFHPLPAASKTVSLVFSGNLDYHPNQQAVRFFRRQVWPLLRERHPSLVWRILGKNERGVRSAVQDDPRIELTGAVPDAIAELAKSQIAVVPVLAGSGTRVKILEAWAAGLPVVSTSIGAEGLDAVSGQQILLADSPAEFAASITQLLEGELLRKQLATAGRSLYEQKYTWNAAWRHLDGQNFLAR